MALVLGARISISSGLAPRNKAMLGKNLVFDQRFADCRYDLMPGLATSLSRFGLVLTLSPPQSGA